MNIYNEKSLVQKLDKILKKEFGTNLSFHEFSAGYGIADLVFASNFSFSKKYFNTRTPLTNFNSLNIFLTLKDNKSYKLDDILEIFPRLSNNEVKKQIKFLTINNYLEKSKKGRYKKTIAKNHLNPIQKIIAIEVKLKDHRNGLVQARRYQYFADETYLAILQEAEKNINIKEFNKYNIGLILFNTKTNTVEIKYPKAKNKIYKNSISLFAKEIMLNQFMVS